VHRVVTDLTHSPFRHAGFACAPDGRRWNAFWGRQFSLPHSRLAAPWQKFDI
jgi:hypothetical protein